MLQSAFNIFCELAPWLLLGAFVAGMLHVLVPASWFKQSLGGRLGVLKSVLVGVPLPLCSCGVIPVGLSLRKNGAGDGATVGFLISTPQTGVDSILVSASFLGWPFALFKVAAAFVTGLVGGYLTNVVSDQSADEPVASDDSQAAQSTGLRAGFDHGLMLIRSIYLWILVGVVASALITSLVPEESLANVAGFSGLTGMLVVLLISLPLYVCATASVPIAAALVASGLPTGSALVFLMAGPATNIATLGAIYRTLGLRNLSVYLGTIIVGSLGAGLLFDQLIESGTVAAALHEHGTSWWSLLSAGVLGLLMLWLAADDVRHWLRRTRLSQHSSPTIVLQIEGMTCDGCAASLERGLCATSGIESATVSFKTRTATISTNLPTDALADHVRRCGFSVGTSAAE